MSWLEQPWGHQNLGQSQSDNDFECVKTELEEHKVATSVVQTNGPSVENDLSNSCHNWKKYDEQNNNYSKSGAWISSHVYLEWVESVEDLFIFSCRYFDLCILRLGKFNMVIENAIKITSYLQLGCLYFAKLRWVFGFFIRATIFDHSIIEH